MRNQSLDDTSKKRPNRHEQKQAPKAIFVAKLQQLGFERIIGIDEVGRGALAGPLVVAAVEIYQPIIGINDSKLVNRAYREKLFEPIRRSSKQIGIGQVSHNEIDMLGLSAAQNLAYERCLDGMNFDLVLTDNYALKSIRYLKAVKGDRLFYPIAAASIVAKVYRDQLMGVYHQIYPEYGWNKNVGYGTAEHKKSLNSLGPSPLHRQSFLH